LNAALVGDPAHKAVQSIDFPDQMALSKTANGGIAGHCTNGRKLMGHQRGFCPCARGRRRSFTAGVASPDHNDIECGLHRQTSIALVQKLKDGNQLDLFHVKQ
jgi:hypothetical protein